MPGAAEQTGVWLVLDVCTKVQCTGEREESHRLLGHWRRRHQRRERLQLCMPRARGTASAHASLYLSQGLHWIFLSLPQTHTLVHPSSPCASLSDTNSSLK